ncbi:MAG: AMP-binding protein [bacterium]|nr:AMP-binding protein [bacterium]
MNASLIAEFQHAVTHTPDRVFLVDPPNIETYSSAGRRVGQIAHLIQEVAGAAPVLVPAEKSADAVLTILASVALGRPYVPLGPMQLHQKTLGHILNLVGSCCAVLPRVSGTARESLLESGLSPERMVLVSDADQLEPITPHIGSRGPAYVLFTSGTTGPPKGVVVPEAAVLNLTAWSSRWLMEDGESVMGLSPLTFDLSVLDLFGCIAAKGSYHIIPEGAVANPPAVFESLCGQRCTFLQTVPSLASLYAKHLESLPRREARSQLSSLTTVVFAGEALDFSLVERWSRITGARQWNMYGPTETIHVTAYEVPEQRPSCGPVPIGKPIPNVKITLKAVPADGVARGIAVISGKCVADGYLGAHSDEVVRFGADEGERSYDSGDVLSRKEDGILVFEGRTDDEVKVRGHRIRLGDVEGVAREILGVDVIALPHPPESALKLLLVALEPRRRIGTDARPKLNRALAGQIPFSLHSCAYPPITSRGKLDRGELYRRLMSELATVSTRPTSEAASRRTYRPVTPQERYLLARERFASQGEHPSALLRLPRRVTRDQIATRLSTIVGLTPDLRKVVIGNQLEILDRSVASSVESCIEEAVADSSPNLLMNRLFRDTLIPEKWPLFRLAMSQCGDATLLGLRCHHVMGGGGQVLRWLGQLVRSEHGRQRPNCFFLPEPTAESVGSPCHRVVVAVNGDERVLVRLGSWSSLLGVLRSRLGSPGLGLMSIHHLAASRAGLSSVAVEFPTLVGKTPRRSSLPVMGVVRPSGELRHGVPLLATCEYSDDVARSVKSRWNFMPIDSFVGVHGVEMLPLDSLDPIPPLPATVGMSVLAQVCGDELLLVVRGPRGLSETYAAAIADQLRNLGSTTHCINAESSE